MHIKKSSTAILLLSLILLSCTFASSLVPKADPTGQAGIPQFPSADCSKFTLTPEECANAGIHEYSTRTQVLYDQSGNTCLTDKDNIGVSITFLGRDTFFYINSFGTKAEFTQKHQNYYEGEYTQPDGKFAWKNTITFTREGLIHQADSFDLTKNEHLCTFRWEQKIVTDNAGTSTLSENDSAELTRIAIENIVEPHRVQVFWHSPEKGHLIFGIVYATGLKPESQPEEFADLFNRVTFTAATYFHQTRTKAENVIVMAEDVDFPTSDHYPPLRQVILEKDAVSTWMAGEKTDTEFIGTWFVVPIEAFPTPQTNH